MYFKTLPNIVYKTPADKTFLAKDFFIRTGFKNNISNNLNMDAYYLDDGETAEQLATRVYGAPQYHWVIFLVNNIVNVHEEWPKSSNALIDYVTAKYGSLDGIHHYRITGTETIVDYDAAAIANGTHEAVTNYDYELDLNESKRHIYLLKSRFIGEFVKTYRRLVS